MNAEQIPERTKLGEEDARLMALLAKDEYLATFVEPMRRLEAHESYKAVPISNMCT